MSDIVRVMKIIIYEGPREWVEETVKRSTVKGTHYVDSNRSKKISGYIINEFPEIIKQHEEGIKDGPTI